jgi:transcriptional regulator with XRE-family HTH domain
MTASETASFGAVLLRRRLATGLTKHAIQRRTGIQLTTLSAYENDVREPPPAHRNALRKFFGLDENDDDGWWRLDW